MGMTLHKGEGGTYVTGVEPAGQAARRGVKTGMLLVRVGGRAPASFSEAGQMLTERPVTVSFLQATHSSIHGAARARAAHHVQWQQRQQRHK
jgi:hypothetical protein